MPSLAIYFALAWLIMAGFWEGRQNSANIPGSSQHHRSNILAFAAMDPRDILGHCPHRDRVVGGCDRFTSEANGKVALCLAQPQNISVLSLSCRRWLLRTLAIYPTECVKQFETICPGQVGVLRQTACHQSRPAQSLDCQQWQTSVRRIIEVL